MNNFVITSIPTKKSASNSIIIIGTLCDKKVVGKFYIKNLNDIHLNFSGIIYEQKIYKLIRNKSIEKPAILDNVLQSIYDYNDISLYNYISDNDTILSNKLTEQIQFLTRKITDSIIKSTILKKNNVNDTYIFNSIKFNGFILDKIDMLSLAEYINVMHYTTDDIIEIFFELIYSNIIYRNYLKIIHNDEHYGNIFIIKLDSPIENYYYEFLGIYKTKKFKIILYDNDHNYSSELGDNQYINNELCKKYGSCNIYNNKDGFYILINFMYYFIPYKSSLFDENNFNIKLFKILSKSSDRNFYDEFRFIIMSGNMIRFCDWNFDLNSKLLNATKCGDKNNFPDLNINRMMDRYIENFKDQLSFRINENCNKIHTSIYLLNETKKNKYTKFDDNYYTLINTDLAIIKDSTKLINKYEIKIPKDNNAFKLFIKKIIKDNFSKELNQNNIEIDDDNSFQIEIKYDNDNDDYENTMLIIYYIPDETENTYVTTNEYTYVTSNEYTINKEYPFTNYLELIDSIKCCLKNFFKLKKEQYEKKYLKYKNKYLQYQKLFKLK